MTDTTAYSPNSRTESHRHNWALWVGAFLAGVMVLIGLFGPALAPKDPLENVYIGKSGTRFIRPPFPPGAVEDYPLGSDEFGRDVLSKVLWAVQPTMNLVLVVSGLRLLVGLGIGLVSGLQPAGQGLKTTRVTASWNMGGVLDALISGALAVPVLFVALCVVAALAQRWGLWAFILGLSITGWAETARLVHDQARAIKAQPFVEASEALGAMEGQVVFTHVIPHLLPLIWIQLAFEISSVLVSVAALGFLGYFVNAVWVPGETDYVGIRASGAPELGQMLGAAVRSQPWTAMIAGTFVFVIVLAFNLLGEGLRHAFSERREPVKADFRAKADSRSAFFKQLEILPWMEERLYLALAEWQRLITVVGAFGMLALVVFGGGWFLMQSQSNVQAATQIQVPGEHAWAAPLRDAQGTYWSSYSGPSQPQEIWRIQLYKAPEENGFRGGPLIDADGNLYLVGAPRQLYSFDSSGAQRWVVDLPAEPIGWPALTPDGTVIVADVEGNLQALAPTGELRWQYASDPPDEGLSGPVVGPSGTIYYAVKNFLVAVTPQGQRDWQIRLPSYSYTSPLPRLSFDGQFLFFEDIIIDALTGVTLFRETPPPMDRYMVGADGKIYHRTADTIEEWVPTEAGAVLIPRATLDQNIIAAGHRFPFDAGVSPSGNIWLLYSSGFEFMRMVWTGPKGQSPQISDFPYRQGLAVGIDRHGAGYICGYTRKGPFECRAVQLSTGVILWKHEFPLSGDLVGGALTDGRLYLASSKGELIGVGK